jgi:hypothetical protein
VGYYGWQNDYYDDEPLPEFRDLLTQGRVLGMLNKALEDEDHLTVEMLADIEEFLEGEIRELRAQLRVARRLKSRCWARRLGTSVRLRAGKGVE